MATYIMLGKYTIGAINDISIERSKKATAVIEGCGGQLKAVYALLGEIDIVVIVDFPGLKDAMKASVELTKLLGISFSTSPAMGIEEFDKLVQEKH